MSRWRTRCAVATLVIFAVGALAGRSAFAQDAETHGPDEFRAKFREVEHLMKGAERSLARSTGVAVSEQSAKDAAKRLDELVATKAREQAGTSVEQLRREAAEGSAEAAAKLEALTREARVEIEKAAAQAAGAAQGVERSAESARDAEKGVHDLVEATHRDAVAASKGIAWLLEHLPT